MYIYDARGSVIQTITSSVIEHIEEKTTAPNAGAPGIAVILGNVLEFVYYDSYGDEVNLDNMKYLQSDEHDEVNEMTNKRIFLSICGLILVVAAGVLSFKLLNKMASGTMKIESNFLENIHFEQIKENVEKRYLDGDNSIYSVEHGETGWEWYSDLFPDLFNILYNEEDLKNIYEINDILTDDDNVLFSRLFVYDSNCEAIESNGEIEWEQTKYMKILHRIPRNDEYSTYGYGYIYGKNGHIILYVYGDSIEECKIRFMDAVNKIQNLLSE